MDIWTKFMHLTFHSVRILKKIIYQLSGLITINVQNLRH